MLRLKGGGGWFAAWAVWPKIGQAADVVARLQRGDGGLEPVSRAVVPALRAQRTGDAAHSVPALQMARGVRTWSVGGNWPRALLMRDPCCQTAGLLKPPCSRRSW